MARSRSFGGRGGVALGVAGEGQTNVTHFVPFFSSCFDLVPGTKPGIIAFGFQLNL